MQFPRHAALTHKGYIKVDEARKMNRVYMKAVVGLLCTIFAIGFPVALYAHAVLVESNPKAGSTVKGPNLSIWLRFNVRIDARRSSSSLLLADGIPMPLAFDPQDKPNLLSGKATGLNAGKYKLQWQVLAADGHITRGEFTFYVQ